MKRRRFGKWAFSLVAVVAACANSQGGSDSESHFVCASDEECRVELGYGYECVARECRVADKDAAPTRFLDGAPGEASSGAGGAGGSPNTPELCLGAPRKTWPARPTTSGPGAGDIEFVSAMYAVDLGDRQPNPVNPPTQYRNIGLDLDGTCTTEDDLSSGECNMPSWASGTVDGPGGVDNSVGQIFQSLRDRLTTFSSEIYQNGVQSGGVNVLYAVSGYNGTLNDDEVRVDMFIALPFSTDGGVPRWDGTDGWAVASHAVTGVAPSGLAQSRYYDGSAYVTNGTLAASLPEASIRLDLPLDGPSGSVKLDIALAASALVCDLIDVDPATLAPGATPWEMDCVLAGRCETDNLLRQLSQFPDPSIVIGGSEPEPVCTNSVLYQALKRGICSPTDTFVGMIDPSSVCNALSFGMHFMTRPARITAVDELAPLVPRCPTESEPSNDTCDTLPPPSGIPDAGSSPEAGTSSDGGT